MQAEAPAPIKRWLAFAAVPVFWLGLAGPLYTLPVFKRGFWELAEPLVIGSFAAAGLAALLLAIWLLVGGRPSRAAIWLAMPAFGLGLWLLFSGPGGFALEHWRLRLLGTAQSGYGALWFCALGCWLLLGDLLRRQALAWRLGLWGGLLAAAGIVGVLLADFILDRSTVFTVLAYYGWIGLLLPAIALALPRPAKRQLRDRLELLLALLLALAVLLLCKAITLLGAGLIGLIIALAWHWLPQEGGWALLRRPAWQPLLLAVAALAPLVLVSQPELTQQMQSLESRRLVWRMVWLMLGDQPQHWLLGHGVGSVPDMMMQQLAATGYPLWDLDGWDLLTGDYFDVHNWILQALHDGGLPAVLLMAWLLLQPVWRADNAHHGNAHHGNAHHGAALGLTVAYLIGIGLWFQLIFVLPYLALAWLAVVMPGITAEAEAEARTRQKTSMAHFATAAGLLLLAGCYGWGALALERFARQFDAQIAWLYEADERQRPGQVPASDAPLPPPPAYPEDPRRHDVVMADMMMQLNGRFIARYSQPVAPEMHDRHVQRLQWQAQIIRDHLASASTPRFAYFASQLFSNVMLLPELEKLRPALQPYLPLWRQAIDRGLQLAPKRPDIALGYLNWTLQNGRSQETLNLARILRQRNADDPIGLYFEGGVLVLREDQASKQQGIALLRRAFAMGVEQYFKADETLKRNIGAL